MVNCMLTQVAKWHLHQGDCNIFGNVPNQTENPSIQDSCTPSDRLRRFLRSSALFQPRTTIIHNAVNSPSSYDYLKVSVEVPVMLSCVIRPAAAKSSQAHSGIPVANRSPPARV